MRGIMYLGRKLPNNNERSWHERDTRNSKRLARNLNLHPNDSQSTGEEKEKQVSQKEEEITSSPPWGSYL